MPIKIASLSFKTIGEICKFIPEQSIAQLRQVCKSINNKVCSLVKILTTDIQKIMFRLEFETSYELLFLIQSRKDYFWWKLCFHHAVNENQLSCVLYFDKNANSASIKLSITPENVKTVLHWFKHLLQQTRLRHFHVIDHIKSEILALYVDLAVGKSLEDFHIMDNAFLVRQENKENIDFDFWSEWFRKIRTQSISIYKIYSFNKEAVNFLFTAAEISNKLCVMFDASVAVALRSIPSIVHGILSRKCENLEVAFIPGLSPDYVENMIEMLHHIDKKIELVVTYSVGTGLEISSQVGMYQVNAGIRGLLSINHV